MSEDSQEEIEPPSVDPNKVNREDELIFGHTKSGNKPLDLLSDYLPEKEDYGAKTVLTARQVHLLAALEQVMTFYPELQEYDEVLTEWIAAYEKRKTSVEGLSRSEFLEILVSFSGGSVDKEERKKLIDKVLDTNLGDDNDD